MFSLTLESNKKILLADWEICLRSTQKTTQQALQIIFTCNHPEYGQRIVLVSQGEYLALPGLCFQISDITFDRDNTEAVINYRSPTSILENSVGQLGPWRLGVSNIQENPIDGYLRATLNFSIDENEWQEFIVATGHVINLGGLLIRVHDVYENIPWGSVTISAEAITSIIENNVAEIGEWRLGVSNIWEDAGDSRLRATLSFWKENDEGQNFRVAQNEIFAFDGQSFWIKDIKEGEQRGSVTLTYFI